MADIMLVLLIIFMVVTPMLTKGFPADLAKVNNPTDMPNADKDDAVIIGISAGGDIYLATTRRILLKLPIKFATASPANWTRPFSLRATPGQVRSCVKAVDEIRAAGVDNVGLLTDKSEQNRRTAPPPPPQISSCREARPRGFASRICFVHLAVPTIAGTRKIELRRHDNGNGRRSKGRCDGDDERRPAD